jgi:hypothetical protein
VSSPLRRTLYTTLLVFATSINQRGLRVIALPDAQETSSSPCDVGSSLEALKKEFDEEFEGVIDFGALDEGWNVKVRMERVVEVVLGKDIFPEDEWITDERI